MHDQRALLVLPEPPVPLGGPAARWYHVLLKGLIAREFRTTVLIASGGAERDREAKDLHGGGAELRFFKSEPRGGLSRLLSLLQPMSFPYSPEMRDALYRLPLADFKLIQFETVFSGWLVDRPIPRANLNVLNLYRIDHQAIAGGTLFDRLLRLRIRQAERCLLKRFEGVTALSERLAREVRRIHPSATVAVAPMTIDPALYSPPMDPFDPDRRVPPAPTIGLIGSFNWTPTFSAGRVLTETIWPAVKKKLPEAKLLIVGRRAKAAFAHLTNQPDIEIQSDVADALPFVHHIDAMVYLPTTGSGMKVKILEALAMGTPIVTNDEGTEGLSEDLAQTIRTSSIDAAVHRSVALLTDRPRARKDAAELRTLFLNELSMQTCVDRILDIHASRNNGS